MNTDVTQNLVAFQAHGLDDPVVASAPTVADDALRQAWAQVRAERQVQPADVTAVYSEWEPSAEDLGFVALMFPGARHTYSFDRPGPDGWAAAFAEAERVLAEQAAPAPVLLPVLWSASSPRAELLGSIPHHPLVPGRLSVGLAHVGPTPRGTLGMNHLTTHGYQEAGSPPFAELMAEAGANLKRGLRVTGHRGERGDLLHLTREDWLAGSALALDDFGEQMARNLGEERLVVGLPCPDELVVAGADSGWAEVIHEQVLGSEYDTTELVPCVVLLEPGGMRLLAERRA
ncbi:hypothetical protein [Amycolatopsis thermophila]|uniref:Uncharacterized protein n=1 Tax=Amycolatopsis thermophila TaxID=206084 RepID=A0ABU0EN63_9PSEU|nr:hypothetical protein [Amycolatopsis thermophila]MDQ0376723.1 hypothetical protein [Amycolatopsis thermophila]